MPPGRGRNGSNGRGKLLLLGIAAIVALGIGGVVAASFLGGGDDNNTPVAPTASRTRSATPTEDDGATTPTPSTTPGTATPPASPTPTPTLPPTRPPTTGRVLYSEAFNTSSSSIQPFASDYGRSYIDNGNYVIEVVETKDFIANALLPATANAVDVSMKVDVQTDSGDALIYVACRNDDFYAVRATFEPTDSYFSTTIADRQAGKLSTYQDWTKTNFINPTGWNTYEIICKADRLDVVVNGYTVASHTISGTSGAGLWFGLSGPKGAKARFDNVVVRQQ
jgi:hypothetical protein